MLPALPGRAAARSATLEETLTTLNLAIDAVIVIMTVWLAVSALGAEDHFDAAIRFVAFGLAVTLAWVRLRAPDVALAEAAVGSGLTGALLLAAIARMRQHRTGPIEGEDESP